MHENDVLMIQLSAFVAKGHQIKVNRFDCIWHFGHIWTRGNVLEIGVARRTEVDI